MYILWRFIKNADAVLIIISVCFYVEGRESPPPPSNPSWIIFLFHQAGFILGWEIGSMIRCIVNIITIFVSFIKKMSISRIDLMDKGGAACFIPSSPPRTAPTKLCARPWFDLCFIFMTWEKRIYVKRREQIMRLTKLEDYPCELHINYNFLATGRE